MLDEMKKTVERLQDTEAGWVTRRDAAQHLGQAASLALVTLHEHRDEMDVDVKRAVEKALGQASAALQGIAPAPSPSHSFEELARFCERKGVREVKQRGDGYTVDVKLKSGRTQEVFLEKHTRKDGIKLIRVYTYCGAFDERRAEWALRANMKLAQGAVAVTEKDGEKRFALLNCFLADEVTPGEFKASVKEIAFYADWIENKLSGMDDF